MKKLTIIFICMLFFIFTCKKNYAQTTIGIPLFRPNAHTKLLKKPERVPFTKTEWCTIETQSTIQDHHFFPDPYILNKHKRISQLTVSQAFSICFVQHLQLCGYMPTILAVVSYKNGVWDLSTSGKEILGPRYDLLSWTDVQGIQNYIFQYFLPLDTPSIDFNGLTFLDFHVLIGDSLIHLVYLGAPFVLFNEVFFFTY